MPILFVREFDSGSITGVWHITETSAELTEKCCLQTEEKQYLKTLKYEGRKKHWLSYRVLLQDLLGTQSMINYTDFGKPLMVVDGKQYHISITHSGDYSAIIINNSYRVGIDIEKISPRIERVAERFLNKEELAFLDKNKHLEHLTICWSAKEALFKLFGDDFYEFKDEILLKPFKYSEKGEITALLKNNKRTYNLKVSFEKISDYYLSYTVLDEIV